MLLKVSVVLALVAIVYCQRAIALWGDNLYGETDGEGNPILIPTTFFGSRNFDMNDIKQVGLGISHWLALMQDGSMYSAGDVTADGINAVNGEGEVPSTDYTQSFAPVAVKLDGALDGEVVESIAVGSYHDLVLTASKKIFSWGQGSRGAFGVGQLSTNNLYEPTALDMDTYFSNTIESIWAGYQQSFAIDVEGNLYGWGNNEDKQIDTSVDVSVFYPRVINHGLGQKIKKVAAGISFTLVIAEDNKLYGWGNNDKGQLGDGAINNGVYNILPNVEFMAVAAGALHSAAISTDGELYTFGDATDGKLGVGDSASIVANVPPTKITIDGAGKMKFVSCGETFTQVVGENNVVYGAGQMLRLGIGSDSTGPQDTFISTDTSVLGGNTISQLMSGSVETLVVYDTVPVPTNPEPSDPLPTNPLPTNPPPTNPPPTNPPPTNPPPTNPPPTNPPPTNPPPTNPPPTNPPPTNPPPTNPPPTNPPPTNPPPTNPPPTNPPPTNCGQIDTSSSTAMTPIVTATAEGTTITITVKMYRQSANNLVTPIYHTLDTKEQDSNVCRPSSDNLVPSVGVNWVIGQPDQCLDGYILTQTLDEIMTHTNNNNNNNNWESVLGSNGQYITYKVPIYATYSVNVAPGDCYYVGYRIMVQFKTELSLAASTDIFTTVDDFYRFSFTGLRVTADDNLEVKGNILPLVPSSVLQNIAMTKMTGSVNIPTATTTCSDTTNGCVQLYLKPTSELGGAGANIGGVYRISADANFQGHITNDITLDFTIQYIIPTPPLVVTADDIITSQTLYKSDYSTVRTAAYNTQTDSLYIVNRVTSGNVPSSLKLSFSAGYLCCLGTISGTIPEYTGVAGTGCSANNGFAQWAEFAPAGTLRGDVSVSAGADRTQYKVGFALNALMAGNPRPNMKCEVLLLSKFTNNARRGNAKSGTFVSTIPFSIEGSTQKTQISSGNTAVVAFTAVVVALISLIL